MRDALPMLMENAETETIMTDKQIERLKEVVEEAASVPMQIPVVLDEGAFMPTKAHEWDAGFDLKTPKDEYLMNGSSITIDTGVHMAIPQGYVGMLKSKSGLNVKHGITCDGTIDAGYTGSIKAKLYNDSREPYQFQKGDKVTQIVIIPIPKVELVQTDTLEETDRGSCGFGSSGR